MIASITGWFSRLFSGLWDGFLQFLSTIVQFGVDVLTLLLNLCIDAVFWVFYGAFYILPSVPDLPFAGTFVADLFGMANYFFPVAELLMGLTFIAAVYGVRGLVNLARFIRGGG